jgi:type I restriction enzyme S subunit
MTEDSVLQKLDELGIVARGKSKHRPRNDPPLFGGKYPFIQTGDVKHSPLYITKYSQTYNDKGLSQSKLWEPGTLCITIAANIADTAILGIQACFPDSIIGFVPYKHKADVRFVKYCLESYKLQIQSISWGTTQDNLSLEKLRSISFKIPALQVQRKIAAVLTAYDDLIENNRQRIALLERMAEEIYREWFVRLRFPGHEHTPIHKGVPEGWEIRKLGDILELNYGKALKAADREPGDVPVYGSGGIVGFHSSALVGSNGLIVGRKGNVGAVYYSDRPFFPIDTVFYVVSKWPSNYLFYLLQSMNFIDNDAAVPGLNRKQALSNKLVLPDSRLISRFTDVVGPIFEQKKVLGEQINVLSQTRDLLLNRLISGKLRVDDLDIAFPPSMVDAVSGPSLDSRSSIEVGGEFRGNGDIGEIEELEQKAGV